MGLPQIYWGDLYQSRVDLGYVLDNPTWWSQPREGSQRRRVASGAFETEYRGTDYYLTADLRWQPQADNTNPVQTAWDAPNGAQAAFIWAHETGSPLRLVLDGDYPDAYVEAEVVAPWQEEPQGEGDGLYQRVRVTLRQTVRPWGMLLRGVLLEFAAGQAVPEGATFTRSTVGTYVGRDGWVYTAGVDVLRTEWVDTNGDGLGDVQTTLLEGSHTNLLLRSAELGHSPWTNGGSVAITEAAMVGPDKGLTGTKLNFSTTTSTNFLSQTYSIADPENRTFVFSLWLKDGTLTEAADRFLIQVRRSDGSDSSSYSIGAGTLKLIRRCAGGWSRWWGIKTFSASTTGNDVQILIRNQGVTGYFYAWGTQLTEAKFPSSYVATTTATVTRAADALILPLPAGLNPQTLTLYAKLRRPIWADLSGALGTNPGVADLGDDPTDHMWIYADASTRTWFTALESAGAVSKNPSIPAGDPLEIAAAYDLSGTGPRVRADTGSGFGTYTSVAGQPLVAFAAAQVRIGGLNGGANHLYGNLERLKILAGEQTVAQAGAA